MRKDESKYSKDDFYRMYSLYKEYMNLTRVGKELGIPRKAVGRVLRKYGVSTENYRFTPKYTEKWDKLCPNKLAYIVGLLATDGYLESKRTYVGIGLKEDDKETVEMISKALSEPPMTVAAKQSTVRRFFNREKSSVIKPSYYTKGNLPRLYKFLRSIGFTEHKTNDLNMDLSFLTPESAPYFIRGVIDGDGSVTYRKQLSGCRISITSNSLEFLHNLQSLIGGTICDCGSYGRKDEPYNAKVLTFRGNSAKNLAAWLPVYDDFLMDRKTKNILLVRDIPVIKPGKCVNRFVDKTHTLGQDVKKAVAKNGK